MTITYNNCKGERTKSSPSSMLIDYDGHLIFECKSLTAAIRLVRKYAKPNKVYRWCGFSSSNSRRTTIVKIIKYENS